MAKVIKSANILVYALSASLIIVGLAAAYYFVIALPKIQADKQILETQKFELEKSAQTKENVKEKYYQICASEAESQAQDLLKSKVELASKYGGAEYQTLKEASEKGMYLKDDYATIYDNCLRRNGLK